MAERIGLQQVFPSHCDCFVKRTFDPVEWAYTTTSERPAVIGRQPIGRITIANSDAAASPHTDAAIGEAYRAVAELTDG